MRYSNLNPRLTITKAENNILMSQIRAERKPYVNRQEPFIYSHKDENHTGKKIFKEHLYNCTALDQQMKNRSKSRSSSPIVHTGKRIGYVTPGERKDPSPAGKKRVPLMDRTLK